jgi:hypothetical protein
VIIYFKKKSMMNRIFSTKRFGSKERVRNSTDDGGMMVMKTISKESKHGVDCEWEIVEYGEIEYDGKESMKRVWLNRVMDYLECEKEISRVAVVCRKFRRVADGHDSWKRRVVLDGIRVEAARVGERERITTTTLEEEEEDTKTKFEKDDFRILSRTNESLIGDLPSQSYKKIYIASKIASSSSRGGANAYLKSLSSMLSSDLKDAAIKITLVSGTFLLIAPVCVNGAVGMLFCTWQQGWVMWAIRTTVAEYGWASACTAGAFVLKRVDKRTHPASRVLQAAMAAVAGYLSHVAFVCLI